MSDTKVYPIADILDPENVWEVESGIGGTHIKQSRPRAGGGTIMLDLSDTESARIERLRSMLNVRYGQPSKVGNIRAPLSLFEAVERLRIDALGDETGMWDGLNLDLVFGGERTLSRIIPNSFTEAGQFDAVAYARQVLPFVWRHSIDELSDIIDDLFIPQFAELIGVDVTEYRGMIERFLRQTTPQKYMLFGGTTEAKNPKSSITLAEKLFQFLMSGQTNRSREAKGMGTPEIAPDPRASSPSAGKPKKGRKGRGKAFHPTPDGKKKGKGDAHETAKVPGSGASGSFILPRDVDLTATPGKSAWMAAADIKDDKEMSEIKKAAKSMTDGARRHHDDANVEWGSMAIIDLPKTKNQPARIRGRKNKPSDIGSALRHPHRITTDRRVFSHKKSGVEGTVLIDVSGSMSLSIEDLERILELLPASTVAVYSGPYTPEHPEMFNDALFYEDTESIGGALRIIAKNNRIADLNKLRVIPEHLGGGSIQGGNVVDGPALQWLSKQQGPLYWVCDGIVTGVEHSTHGRVFFDGFSSELAKEAAAFCVKNRILRVHSMSALLRLIEEKKVKYAR